MQLPLKVLMVEDNPADVRLVKELLHSRRDQFDLMHADRLQDALRVLADNDIDIVLLDLSLPDAAGLEGLWAVLNQHTNVAIIVLSGMADENIALQAVEKGAQDYLIKGQVSGELLSRSIFYAAHRKTTETKLTQLAQYDVLTHLPNRNLFRERIQHALQRCRRTGKQLALMLLDLDRFKEVNDTLGHDAGDLLLTQVASRLSSTVRQDDTVARIGGDEFTILLEDIPNRQDAALVAEKICEIMQHSFDLYGHEIYISASVGIAVFPETGKDETLLLKHADLALYEAKNKGRANYQFFDDEINSSIARRVDLINQVRQAAENQQFEIHYQPIYQLYNHIMCGIEALLRLPTGEQENIPPADFIPILEETGLINPVGDWAIKSVIQQMRRWIDEGLPPLRVSINLSSRQLLNDQLVKNITEQLASNHIDPKWLVLEISEATLLSATAETLNSLQHLKTIGVQICLDRFGEGQSIISQLHELPVNSLKLDKHFIDELGEKSYGPGCVAALISLAHSVGLTTAAVGVEKENQSRFLYAQGCDEAQGHYYARALPPDDIGTMLAGRAEFREYQSL